MRNIIISASTALAGVIATGSIIVGGSVFAQDVKSLRGKPNSNMILEALSPSANPDAPAVSSVRRRGLSLGSDAAKEPTATAEQTAPATPVATASGNATAAAKPVVATASAAEQPRSQPRALDLDIQFQFNSDQLTNDGKDVLDQLAVALKSDQLATARSIILEGHADAKGSANYNQALSVKRAQAARNYLATRHGISSGKLKAFGKGSSEPADPNNPEDEVNRRVRVIVDI